MCSIAEKLVCQSDKQNSKKFLFEYLDEKLAKDVNKKVSSSNQESTLTFSIWGLNFLMPFHKNTL